MHVWLAAAILYLLTANGARGQAGQLLIYNGKDTQASEVPWHAGIYKLMNGSYTQQCGGTLISKKVIVTAGHCFWNETYSRPYDASDYKVALGKYHRDWYVVDVGMQKMDVAAVYVHRRYRGRKRKFEYDLAVLQLTQEAQLTNTVDLATLDWNNTLDSQQLAEGNHGTVAGWGITEEGRSSNFLKSAVLPYVDPITCYDLLTDELQEMVTLDKFCAGYTGRSTSVCPGDSGGGLVFRDVTAGVNYLRGVVSIAFKPAHLNDKCYAQQVTGFSRLSDARTLRWIKQFPLTNLSIEMKPRVGNNACSINDNAALLQAVQDGQLAQVQCLIENGADPSTRDAAGRASVDVALLQAGEWGNLDVFRFLLRRGGNPGAQNSAGNAAVDMALLKAAEWGQLDTARDLIETYRANPNARHVAGNTPLLLAALVGNLDLVTYLIDHGAVATYRYQETDRAVDVSLLKAAEWGQLDKVKYLLEKGGDPRYAGKGGFPAGNLALWKAAEWGRTDSARLLTSPPYNVDPNVRNKDGKTAHEIAMQTPTGAPVALLLAGIKVRS